MTRWAGILQRSPHPARAVAFAERLGRHFRRISGVDEVVRKVELLNGGFRGRMEYAVYELMRKGRAVIRALARILRR